MASPTFPQKVIALLESKYGTSLTVVNANTCLLRTNVRGIDLTVEINIGETSSGPHDIRILSPFSGFKVNHGGYSGGMKFTHLDELLGSTLSNLRPIEEWMTMVKSLRAKIKPPTTKHSILILGARPNEYLGIAGGHTRRDRPLYDDPEVYLLDGVKDVGDRFINIDFQDARQLDVLATLLPNTFDEIGFDSSVIQNFVTPVDTLKDRVQSILKMIKPGGVFYVPGKIGRNGRYDADTPFHKAMSEVGFIRLPTDNPTVTASHYRRAIKDDSLVSTFVKPLGGGAGGGARGGAGGGARRNFRRSSRVSRKPQRRTTYKRKRN